MEDEHICVDNLVDHLDGVVSFPLAGAFYGVSFRGLCDHALHFLEFIDVIVHVWQVFDGHGGKDAASFVRRNILKFIIEDSHFPICIDKAMKSAFVRADHAFADAHSLDSSSGTTALTALIFGRFVFVQTSN